MPGSVYEIALTAQLAVSLALALLFDLLSRHDPRPYLRDWAAAWLAQALAAAALIAFLRGNLPAGAHVHLFLTVTSALLILAAALEYARGLGPARLRALALLGASLCTAALHFFLSPWTTRLRFAQAVVLGVALLAAAATLWRLREPGALGLRLTTNVLGLLGLIHLLSGALLSEPFFHLAESPALLANWSLTLFLQLLLGVGMTVAVLEGGQFGLATTSAQLKEAAQRLKTLADTDPLTGCFNRRVFRELVDDLRAGHGVQHGSVVLVDLDGLKELNEAKGHAAGDHAIRGLAEAIRSRTRDTDILVRWGGDEFVVVIPGTDRDEGEGRKDQIAAAIREAGLGASAGLAVYDARTDILAAVDEADRVAYEAKILRRAAPA